MNIWKLLGDCAVVSVSMFVGMIIYNMIWDQSEASSEQVRFFLDNCRLRGILTKQSSAYKYATRDG